MSSHTPFPLPAKPCRQHKERAQSQRLASIGMLAAGVAHDFNNLLTVILGHTSNLANSPELPAYAREDLAQAVAAAERAAELTSQLLSFARKHPQFLRPVDFNANVEGTLRMLRRTLGEAIELRYEGAQRLPLIAADPGQLDQVVTNLAINARDAMSGCGRLLVKTGLRHLCEDHVEGHPERQPGAHVCLVVEDTGHGIPEDRLAQIFEPFFTTKEPGRGTGLGLAAVHGIVKQHQGWTEVSSTVGKGTRFELFFPVLAAGACAPLPAAAETHAEPFSAHGRTVLLVEDEEAVRDFARMALDRFGFHVVSAANGSEGLMRYLTHRGTIDALVTDLVMPGGMGGVDLARRLRDRQPELPVVYSTGYSHTEALPDFRETTTEAFLPKPYSATRLVEALAKVLAPAAATA